MPRTVDTEVTMQRNTSTGLEIAEDIVLLRRIGAGNTRLDAVEADVAASQADIGALDARTDILEAVAVDHEERVAVLEAGGGGVDLEPRVVALEAADVVLGSRLDVAEADITALEGADVSLDGRLDAAEADIAALEGADIALDGRLDTAEADIAALEGADIALDGRLDTAETFIAADRFHINCVIIGASGGPIVAGGMSAPVVVPRTGTITGWQVVADVSGSIVVDVWKDTYANYPPTVADTIAGTEKPTLAAAQKAQDLTLTTWTTTVTAGDYLAFKVDSAATVTWAVVTLIVDPT